MTPDLFWISGPATGRLAVLKRPRGGEWLSEEAKGWGQSGLDVVVSLLEPHEVQQLEPALEGAAAESAGLEFISFPIPDRGVPASTGAASALFRKLARALEVGKNVAVHCRQGIGRSGLVATGILMATGIETENAIQAVSRARELTIPETPEQLDWLHRLSSDSVAPSR